MDTLPSEPGTWDAAVLDQFAAHIEAEKDVLTGYAEAAQTVEAPDVRYLIRLILEDEVRHHRIFEEMARSLQGARDWQQVEQSVPEPSRQQPSEEVRRLTEQFLAVEREDKRQLKALARDLQPVAETTLWPLLVDLMALDTEKHLRILEYIAKRARA